MSIKEISILGILKKWIKMRAAAIISLILICTCFIGLSMLYRLDISMSLYGSLICCFIGGLVGILDFFRYMAHFRKLFIAYSNLSIVNELLPEAMNVVEEDYKKIIEELYKEKTDIITKANQKESEMKDYYTLWAHQIKTPIAAMKLLLQGDEPSGSRFYMEQELFRIEQYAEMVLQYLRLESMSSDMIIREYDLYEIVKQEVKKQSVSFINKKISLSFEEFNYPVLTDEKWLAVVIEQILSNCVKYTNCGAITIYMQKGSEGTLIIKDTGMGIRQEDLSRIFQKGFTGYNGRMDKKSTGIGLYLAKQIMDKLSLRAAVESEVSKGTTFSVIIPKDLEPYKNERLTQEM